MAINLDDYDITIECLDNVEEYDIDKWINSSSKPKKLHRKFKEISQLGGSITVNDLFVTSSDIIDIPFLLNNGDKSTLHYTKARLVRFFPSLEGEMDGILENNKTVPTNNFIEKKQSSDITYDSALTKNKKGKIISEVPSATAVIKKAKKRSHNDGTVNIKEEKCVHDFSKGNTENVSSPKNKKRKVNELIIEDGVCDILNISETNKTAKTNDLTVTKKAKKRSHCDVSVHIKDEKSVNTFFQGNTDDLFSPKKKKGKANDSVINSTVDVVEEQKSPQKTKKSNIDLEVEDEKFKQIGKSEPTASNVAIVSETTKPKKKKKSKVTFEDNCLSSVIVKKEKDLAEDLSLSSKFTACLESTEVEVEKPKKEKKKKHSVIIDLPTATETQAPPAKIKKNKKSKINKI